MATSEMIRELCAMKNISLADRFGRLRRILIRSCIETQFYLQK